MAAKTKLGRRHREFPDPLAREIGLRIRALRLEQSISFDAFVEESGLSRGYVSELERGLVVPTVTSLAKVASTLRLHIADLLVADHTTRERIFTMTRSLSPSALKRLLEVAEEAAVSHPRNRSTL